jgi:hypothetical protein
LTDEHPRVIDAVRFVTSSRSLGRATIVAEKMSPERFASMNQHVREALRGQDAAGQIRWMDLQGDGGEAMNKITEQVVASVGAPGYVNRYDLHTVAREATYLGRVLNALAKEGKISAARPIVISHLGYDARSSRSPSDRTLEQLYSLRLELKEARGSVRVLGSTNFAPREMEGVFVRGTGLDWVVP